MKTFRYFVKWYDVVGENVLESKGFVCAKTYAKAMKRIERVHTDVDGYCSLIRVGLCEVETMGGLLDDQEIDNYKYSVMEVD